MSHRHARVLAAWAFVLVGLAAPRASAETTPTCRYENPFSKVPECRAYLGSWTEADARAACDAVFTGVAGELGTEPCSDEGAIGTCTGPEEEGRWIKIWFYGGDPEVTESMCGDFFKGTWDDGSGEGTSSGETMLASAEAIAAMASTEEVEVSPSCTDEACLEEMAAAGQAIRFTPRDGADASMIFYPGAFVDPRAYAPLAHAIARHGVRFILVPMPDNMALNGWERASGIIESDPQETHWFLGGHSMGGAMAAHFLHERAEAFEGLILWAAYADPTDDLSDRPLPVLSLHGSHDGISTPDEIAEHKPYLPSDALFLEIEGGNHAQFGAYGVQKGDGSPLITANEQHDQIAGATVHFVSSVVRGPEPTHPALSAVPQDQTAWCRRLQNAVANLNEALDEAEMVVSNEPDMQAFCAATPTVDEGTVMLLGRISTGGNPTVLDAPPIVAKETWCKVKSQQAVSDSLSRSTAGQAGTCARVNEQTLQWALSQLPEEARKSYEHRGIEVTFADDVDCKAGIDWVDSEGVQVASLSQTRFVVTSSRLLVGDDPDVPEAARQVVYCKLWAPESALLWTLDQARAPYTAVETSDEDGGGCSVSRFVSPSWPATMPLFLLVGALVRRAKRRPTHKALHGPPC